MEKSASMQTGELEFKSLAPKFKKRKLIVKDTVSNPSAVEVEEKRTSGVC